MGIDQWRDEQDWPLPDTTTSTITWTARSREHRRWRRGTAPERQAANTPTRICTTRAARAHLGGRMMSGSGRSGGPVDQRRAESRDDVLCYTTPVLDRPVEVTGHVSLTLSSPRPLGHGLHRQAGRCLPRWPGLYLTDGILRARYRNSLADPERSPRPGLRDHHRPVGHVQRVPARAPDPARDLQQQLPRYDATPIPGHPEDGRGCPDAVNRVSTGRNTERGLPARRRIPLLRSRSSCSRANGFANRPSSPHPRKCLRRQLRRTGSRGRRRGG